MKIGIFIETLDKKGGGPPRSVPILAKSLVSLGADVTLVCLKTEEMNTHILDDTKVVLLIQEIMPSVKDFELLIAKNKFDLIHTQGIWNPFYNRAVNAARRCGIPYVISPRGTLEPWAYAHNGLKKKIAMLLYERKNLKKASCILATAKVEAENIRKFGFKSPIAVIPNGVDLNEYPYRGDDFLSQVKNQILFLSRIDPKKGVELLISSWSKLHERFPNWCIKIVGTCNDKRYLEKLKEQIRYYNLNDSVQISEPVFGKEKVMLYAQSSLFVLPTYSENFGMVVAEAMSCGLPVITTEGAPWESLNKRHLGWWIPVGEEPLTTALAQALKMDKMELFEMGTQASEYVRQTFDSRVIAIQLLQTYNWVVGTEGKPNFVI